MKGNRSSQITLIQEGEIISDDLEVANTLNTFFDSAVSSLGISDPIDHLNLELCPQDDDIDALIRRFSDHPSIKLINANVIKDFEFIFEYTSIVEFENEINKLNIKTSNPKNSVTTNNLQGFKDAHEYRTKRQSSRN